MMIKIIDNFFKDPYAVRNLALSLDLKYEKEKHGRWPGLRVEIPDPYKTAYSNQYKKFFNEPAIMHNNIFFNLLVNCGVLGLLMMMVGINILFLLF